MHHVLIPQINALRVVVHSLLTDQRVYSTKLLSLFGSMLSGVGPDIVGVWLLGFRLLFRRRTPPDPGSDPVLNPSLPERDRRSVL